MTVFSSLLIANRGEIACRIAATAKRLGIKTVAVYTAADCQSLHRRVADAAILIDDYLNAEAVLAAAAAAGAEALHPGCGFLSESAAFAERCRQAGVCFVGPATAAMQSAASKATARRLAAAAGIATVPGFDEVNADDAALQAAAKDLGAPLLIKAAAGGGGRGMRVVQELATFTEALAQARREAKAGFGDDSIILEKYVPRARHLEAQLLADNHGHVVVLGERDCSLQRRHQKVVEEAPAANISAGCRAQLAAAAKHLATAMQYSNVGTVEFLLDCDCDQLYFLEINARLQVEHPVTEMIYGVDLVEWQLRLAAGEPLPTDGWRQQGAAIEARLCAEEPLHDFLPAGGRVQCVFPPAGSGVRIDSGVASGDVVCEQYDSMLAKIIAHGATRQAAQAALIDALNNTRISGVGNNTAFVCHLLQTAEFSAGQATTGMIEAQRAQWTAALYEQQDNLAVLAAVVRLLPPTAAFAAAGLRLNAPAEARLSFSAAGSAYRLYLQQQLAGGIAVQLQRDEHKTRTYRVENIHIEGSAGDARLSAVIDNTRWRAHLTQAADGNVQIASGGMTLTLQPLTIAATASTTADKNACAPMNAVVSSINVQAGDVVAQAAPLLTLEAMKIEIQVSAPVAGVVEKVHCQRGARVVAGALLVEINADGDSS